VEVGGGYGGLAVALDFLSKVKYLRRLSLKYHSECLRNTTGNS
jgi:hypothetical protein